MQLFYLVLFFVLMAFSARAADSLKIQKLSQEHDAHVLLEILNGPRPIPPDDEGRYCPPQDGPVRRDCLDYACKQLGSFGCNTSERIAEVAASCRNVSAVCLRTVCNRLGSFKCNDKEELFEVAGICRGLFDGRCIDYVCKKLSSFECNDIDEIREVARGCR